MKYNHSIIVAKDNQIIHIVGYPNKPNDIDLESLRKEMKNEFGLSDVEFRDGPQELTDWINTFGD